MKKILLIAVLCLLLGLSGCVGNLHDFPETDFSVSSDLQTPTCRHEWATATCLAPRTCLKCNKTIGNKGPCKDDGNGICVNCKTDILFAHLKNSFHVRLAIPNVGENNYYTRVKYWNYTDMTILLNGTIVAGGKTCQNLEADKYAVEGGDEVSVLYYRSGAASEQNENQNNDLYLDNSSLGYTSVQINEKTVYILFDVNGVVKFGYSLQEIGVEA